MTSAAGFPSSAPSLLLTSRTISIIVRAVFFGCFASDGKSFIGGGYPVRHVKPIPSIEVIGEVVNEGLKAFPEDVQVIAEPGRYLVSDAGYFVCRVLGTASRAGFMKSIATRPVISATEKVSPQTKARPARCRSRK